MKWHLYILLLNNGQRYYWSALNLERRVAEHNAGKVTATRHKRPCTLLFTKEYESIVEARRDEYKIKKMKNKNYIMKYVGFESSAG